MRMYDVFRVMVNFMGSTLLFLVGATTPDDAVTLAEVRYGNDTRIFIFDGDFARLHNATVETTKDTSGRRGVIDWRKIR